MKTFLQCNVPVRGDKCQIRRGSNQPQLQILGGLVFFVTLGKQFAEKANESYQVYKEIVVLHIYYKNLGIRLAGHPANQKECFILIKF